VTEMASPASAAGAVSANIEAREIEPRKTEARETRASKIDEPMWPDFMPKLLGLGKNSWVHHILPQALKLAAVWDR
jgi:hypothetical protein